MFFDQLKRDLRQGLRALTKSPGFTAVAVLSLALGIGANTAIFTLVNAVLLRELPLDRPEDLVNVYLDQPDFPFSTLSYPDYDDLVDGTRDVFTHVSTSQYAPIKVDRAAEGEVALAEIVSGNYFVLLGVEAALGRAFLPEDDIARGAHPVIMLSYGYWQTAFGGDPAAVGQELRLGGRPYTIIGVVPSDYTGTVRGLEPSIYAPRMMVNELQPSIGDQLEARGNHSVFSKARLQPGVSLAEAQVAADGVATQLSADRLEDWDLDSSFVLVPTESVLLYPPMDRFVRGAAWLLMVVVGLVLLLACTNLASFLLARAVDRRKEISIRLALGATRATLVRQLLTETVVLGLAGGVAGLALAVGLLRLLLAVDLPLPIPVTLDLGLDRLVLFFTLMTSMTAGVLLGLIPAIQATKSDVATSLKSETAGGGQPGRLSLRNALVVTQVAISLVLLVGAGLFLRSFQSIQAVDPGFGRDPTAVMTMLVPSTRYDEDQGRVYMRRMLDRFEQIPGVTSVGLIDNLHLNTLNTQNMNINVDGVEPPPGREAYLVDQATANPEFFEAAGIRLLRGRNFRESDLPESPSVAIISEAMANRFWPDGTAVGQTLRRANDPDLLVVGVASDAKVRSLGEAPRSFVYRPYSQDYSSYLTVVAKTTVDPRRTALDLLATGRELDPELWTWESKTMDQHLGIVLLPARLSALLLSVFGVLALVMASIGLYGVVSYAVAQRAREVGIRMALGAGAPAVVRLLAGNGLRLVVVGCVIGLGLAVMASRLLTGLLFAVDVWDPVTFVAVPVVLGGAALLAAYIPARRVSRVDPVQALRVD